MNDILIKLIECEARIAAYKGFVASLDEVKAANRVKMNYIRYLSKENSKRDSLVKSIQKLYPHEQKGA